MIQKNLWGHKQGLGAPSRAPLAIVVCLLITVCGRGAAEARTTFSARFEPAAVAGPGILQQVALLLSYFPGDGEAVLRTRVRFDPESAVLTEASSNRGLCELEPGAIVLDYSSAPVAAVAEDTLHLSFIPSDSSAHSVWHIETYSTLQGLSQPAQEGSCELVLRPPVKVTIHHESESAFPGTSFDLDVVVRNDDERAISSISWEWPEGLVAEETDTVGEWPLAPAGTWSATYRVHVSERLTAARVLLQGRAQAAEVADSPLPALTLAIEPVPTPTVEVAGSVLVAGRKGQVSYTWSNRAEASIPVQLLRLHIPVGFSDVELITQRPTTATATIARSVLEAGETDTAAEVIDVDVRFGEFALSPGESANVTVSVTPDRSGPFAWKSSFQALGNEERVELAGDVVVGVIEAAFVDAGASTTGPMTDLEAVKAALAARLNDDLRGLPLAAGSSVALEAQKKDDKNWIIEDILTRALLRRGYTVTVKPPKGGGGNLLKYRLLDARVIYTPSRSWNPLASRTRREALGDALLTFEGENRQINWNRRLRGYRAEVLPAEGMQWLGGSNTVDKSAVDLGNKTLEIGLSSLIVGGLFFVFFVP